MCRLLPGVLPICAHLLMPSALLPPAAVVSDSRGRPHTIRRAVCMKEEDAGMAWKHYEYRNGAGGVGARKWDCSLRDLDWSRWRSQLVTATWSAAYMLAWLMWRPAPWHAGHTEVRRNRRLALKFIATIGEYGSHAGAGSWSAPCQVA